MDVAARARAAQLRRALAAQPLHGAALRARRHAQLLAPVERRDLDVRPADRLRDRERDLDLEVVAATMEDRRGTDVRDHVEVARRAAVAPSLALAGEPHARALLDPGRDVHAVLLDRALRAAARTRRARLVNHGAGAVAARARLRDREQALTLGLDAAALALRADLRLRAGLGARAATGRARRGGRHRQRDLRALHRLCERDRDLGLQVAAALLARPASPGRRARPATEEVGQDVAEAADVEAEAGALAGRAARPAAAHPEHAAAVVLLALLRVAQDVVGRLDLLEALLGLLVAGIAVRVVLARQLAVGLLDLLGRGLLVDPEDLVRVHPATTTRAGRRTSSPRR